jgi:hypothetical protein
MKAKEISALSNPTALKLVKFGFLFPMTGVFSFSNSKWKKNPRQIFGFTLNLPQMFSAGISNVLQRLE